MKYFLGKIRLTDKSSTSDLKQTIRQLYPYDH